MVHDAAATGFGSNAEIYAGVRPSYHLALVERFVEAYGRGQVVELGAGTGIFTHQLLDAGVVPVAIEPVAAMRDQLAETCAPVVPLDGTAEETGLPDDGADTVVVAQAFHWFDHGPALDEIRRVLRRGGHLVCVWNVRDTSVEWVRAVTDIVDRYAGDTPRHRTMAWRQAIDDAPGFELVDDWSIENPKPSTPQGAVDRALSTSFIAALDDNEQAEVVAATLAVTTPLGTPFDYPYRSELQAWRWTNVDLAD